jgi:hypothetical protein
MREGCDTQLVEAQVRHLSFWWLACETVIMFAGQHIDCKTVCGLSFICLTTSRQRSLYFGDKCAQGHCSLAAGLMHVGRLGD